MNETLQNKLKTVRVFLTDFDGIHTDGFVNTDGRGREFVKCSRKDGLAYDMLKKAGIQTAIISKEKNPVVARRAKKLGIRCYQGVGHGQGKREIIKQLADELSVTLDQILYMGDDINDSEALDSVGVPVTVSDAHSQILSKCVYVTKAAGGQHAIREIVELVLQAQGKPLTY